MPAQFLTWYQGLTDNLLGSLVLFVLGAFLLIKGGDWFVDGAVGIAKRFHLPEIIIGATVVSIGTTLPEVMVSVTAAVHSHGAIAFGSAIGSIICNTALIAAITVAIRPSSINRKNLITPVLFFFLAASVYAMAAYIFGRFDRWVGIVLLLLFGVYMALTIYKGTRHTGQEQPKNNNETPAHPFFKDVILLVVSAALIAVGADMLEGSSVSLATLAGIPEEVVAVTIVALCTSLPELVTAVTALTKGHGALSLGNVIGANIFNLVLVSGAAVTISPFVVPEGSQLLGCNASLLLEIPLMFGVMALLTLPALIRGKLSRWQGVALLGIYVAFVTLQVLIACHVFS